MFPDASAAYKTLSIVHILIVQQNINAGLSKCVVTYKNC